MTQIWRSGRRWLMGLLLAPLAALAFVQLTALNVCYPGDTSSPAGSPVVGTLAPDFTAETIDGKKIALSEYRGKSAVLLNFYANH